MLSSNEQAHVREPFRDVLDEMIAAEWDFDLFSQTDSGVHYWELARFEVYHRLLGALGPFQEFYDRGTRRKMELLGAEMRGAVSGLLHQPFWPVRRAENVFWLHERKWQVDDEFVDPYMSWLADRLGPDRCRIYDKAAGYGRYKRTLAPFEQTLEAVEYVSRLQSRFARGNNLSAETRRLLAELEARFNERLGVSAALARVISVKISRFRVARRLFRGVFARMEPRRAFVVVAYDRHAYVAAAEDLNIDTFELQHGIIGTCHPGYNYGAGVTVPYKPRKLLTFGDFWTTWGPFPKNLEIVPVGTPTLHDRLSAYKDRGERDIDVIFISQSEIFSLFDFAVDCARRTKSENLVLRPHPKEDASRYEEFLGSNPDIAERLKVVTHREEADTLVLQSRARYQVGIYSTALLEGMQLGCTTILAQIPGWEYFAHLVPAGLCLTAADPADAANIIDSGVSLTAGVTPFEAADDAALREILGD